MKKILKYLLFFFSTILLGTGTGRGGRRGRTAGKMHNSYVSADHVKVVSGEG